MGLNVVKDGRVLTGESSIFFIVCGGGGGGGFGISVSNFSFVIERNTRLGVKVICVCVRAPYRHVRA